MPNSRLPYYDGVFTDPVISNGPVITSVDPETFGTLYTFTFTQTADSYRRKHKPNLHVSGQRALSARNPRTGGYLVEWTNPRDIGCGIVQWERTYALVPPDREEFETYVATYQLLAEETSISEVTLPVKARVLYHYEHTTKPRNLTLRRALKYFFLGSTLNRIGEDVSPGATERLAEDEKLRRWKGNIWEKRTLLIPTQFPQEVV